MEKQKDIVIKFDHVTKTYKLFKNDKKRLLYTFCKKSLEKINGNLCT